MPAEQPVVPMLAYSDGVAAMDWLMAAFGFRELVRWVDEQGRLSHGELETECGGRIMLASPSSEYQGPRAHREQCPAAARWQAVPWVIDGVLVYVRDADAHCERARASGATILTDPESGFPGRRYRAEDPEGHRWMFLERSE